MLGKTGIVRTISGFILFLATYQTQGLPVDIFTTNTISEIITNDTIIHSVAIIIPKELKDSIISFQVNTEISYSKIEQFRIEKAKKEFIDIWFKRQKLDSINAITEQLRSEYLQASSEQRANLTGQILWSEEKSLLLNRDMIDLFYSAQDKENKYWNHATASEKEKLLNENRVIADSLIQLMNKKQKEVNDTPPETFTVSIIEKPKPAEEKAIEEAVIYKIQIGAFSKEPPEWVKRIHKKLSLIRKISNYTDPSGVTVYTVGELRTYNDAIEMQKQVKLEGVRDASVAAYLKGKRISLDEARKINKEDVTKRENKKTNGSGNKK